MPACVLEVVHSHLRQTGPHEQSSAAPPNTFRVTRPCQSQALRLHQAPRCQWQSGSRFAAGTNKVLVIDISIRDTCYTTESLVLTATLLLDRRTHMSPAYTVANLQASLASAAPALLVDVRRRQVFEQSEERIEGAVWRDPEDLENWSNSLDRARPVVVYCVHGHQVSQGCAQQLERLGFEAAFLDGGIEGWKASGGCMAAKTGD